MQIASSAYMAYPQPIQDAKFLHCHVLTDLILVNDLDKVKFIIGAIFHNAAMKYLVVKDGCSDDAIEQSWAAGLAGLPNLHVHVLQKKMPKKPQQQHGRFQLLGSELRTGYIFTTENIRDLTYGDPPVQVPCRNVLDFFHEFGDEWLAFGIETHDLIPCPVGNGKVNEQRQGQFGHQCGIDQSTIEPVRIIQLGWCFGRISTNTFVTKTKLVSPDGFMIADDAVAKHHITNELIRNNGAPLETREFLHDVIEIVGRDGRLCAHQIEFDASVIALEMERVGFGSKAEMWSQAAAAGFCTLNPTVSKWSCELFFDYRHGTKCILGRSSPVALIDMVLAIIPHEFPKITSHHDAGTDAALTWQLVRELSRRASMSRGHIESQ